LFDLDFALFVEQREPGRRSPVSGNMRRHDNDARGKANLDISYVGRRLDPDLRGSALLPPRRRAK
jgi:hypothetical protein